MAYFLLLLSHVFFSTTLHGTKPVVSLFATSQGASPVIIGLLVSAFALFPMLLAIKAGKWLDRYGAKTVGGLGGIGMCLAVSTPIMYPALSILFVSQILLGLGHVCMLVSYQKTAGNWPGDRDKWIMLFSLTGSCGEMIGPLIGGFTYEHLGFQASYAVMAGIVGIGTISGLLLGEKTWKSGAASAGYRVMSFLQSLQLMKDSNLMKALVISGLVLYSKDLYMAYFPVYGDSIGLSGGTIGVILSVTAAAGIVIRLFQFWLVRRLGRGVVLFVTMLLSGLAFIFIPFNNAMVVLMILGACLGAGLGLGQPISVVLALNLSPGDRQGEVLGMRLTFNRLSQFSAPFLFGAIGGAAGLTPIFLISGSILIGGTVLTRIREPKLSD